MKQFIQVNSFYLPPVTFFQEIKKFETIVIEAHEYYVKQSYRNRCNILSANGVLPLVVPIKNGNRKQIMKDVEISYDAPWQRVHYSAITSAYKSSPFFEFIEDYFSPFYIKKEKFLLDFNLKLMQEIFFHLKWKKIIKISPKYEENVSIDCFDFRNALHPKEKHMDKNSDNDATYQQVFHQKFGFVRNLSILDLIFNTLPGEIL